MLGSGLFSSVSLSLSGLSAPGGDGRGKTPLDEHEMDPSAPSWGWGPLDGRRAWRWTGLSRVRSGAGLPCSAVQTAEGEADSMPARHPA